MPRELEGKNFWYARRRKKTFCQLQKGKEERQKKLKAKSRYGDISLILFPAFNPDKFLTWLYARTSLFLYRWFTALTLLAFAFTAGHHHQPLAEKSAATRWQFYNFSHKTWADIVVLLSAGVVICGRWHEIAPRARLQALRRPRPRHGLRAHLSDARFLHRHHRRAGQRRRAISDWSFRWPASGRS